MRYAINYTGVDNSDQLEHWKYVDRYRKNGRWVYVYPEDSRGNHLTNRSASLNKTVAKARGEASKYNSGTYFDKDNPGNFEAEKQQANTRYKRLRADAERAYEAVKENREKLEEKKKWDKTLAGRIERGRDWLENKLNNDAWFKKHHRVN